MPVSSVPEDHLRDPVLRMRALSDLGAAVDVDDNIPPRRYYRSGQEMLRMANIYYEENNLENAFILYSKFITLFVEKLPKHPDYKLAAANDRTNTKKKLKEVFPQAETVKAALLQKYQADTQKYLQEKKKQEEMVALENKRRRQAEQERQRQELEQRNFQIEKQARLMQEWQRRHDHDPKDAFNALPPDFSKALVTDWPSLAEWESPETSSELVDNSSRIPAPDNRVGANLEPISDMASSVKPRIDRSTKPSTGSLLSPGTSSHHGLRNVVVPLSLMTKFLRLAEINTGRGIETCGVLAGCLAQDAFTVTHLLVPKQRGTADSCSTENEEDLFEIQDQYDLLTLGWIHTHPTQTSFMSSVDLHTHCAYQLMMPEAIAIVCAPKFNETGVFSLTPDYGLQFIAKCQLQGFHPHPIDPPLYDTSSHVTMSESAPVKVIDLRGS